jgi:signal transduction histidine kinase
MLQSLPVRFALLALALAVLVATAIGMFVGWRGNQLLTDRALEIIRLDVAGLNREFQLGGAPQLTKAIEARVQTGGPMRYLLQERGAKRLAGNLAELPKLYAGASVPAAQQGTFTYRDTNNAAVDHLAAGVRVPVTPEIMLVVGRDLDDQQAFVRAMQLALTFGTIALTALAFAGAAAARRHFALRVDAVTDTARSIMAGDLSRRVTLAGTGDEIDRLSVNLNDMLARMSQLMSSLREVSDNIAHDLKTPLNRLRNRAEAALRDPAGGPAYRDGLEHTIEEADGLIRTFNALLLIARLEASAVADSMIVLDPAAVVADVAELYQPVAEEAGRTLVVRATGGVVVNANRQLLGQVVSNLVENAIKYGAAAGGGDGRIIVSVAPAADGVEIAVGDHGPGIAEADRERALKRFVRLEESRTQPGTGLGLSLVAAVVRLHGGTLRLEDNKPGLRVVLGLPAAAPLATMPGAKRRTPEPALS